MPTYTIKIPGLTDIFRFSTHDPEPMSRELLDTRLRLQDWPSMTGKPLSPESQQYLDYLDLRYREEHLPQVQRQRERIQRMKQGPSPIPEPLRWIPDVINAIDDAQDILYSAAYLARPLLKRIPGRFIPYVGWGLLALDIANLINSMLGMAMTPCITKPSFINDTKHLRSGLLNPTSAFNAFVNQASWRRHLGALIQAAQAAYTLFDKGLVLGGIMGMMSDAVWSSIQYVLQKGDVKIQYKIGRDKRVDPGPHYLIQTMKMQFWRDILSPEDHIMLAAAQKLAIDAFCEQGQPIDDRRIELGLSAVVPTMIPWSAASIDALQAEGIPINQNTIQATLEPDKLWKYEDLLIAAQNEIDNWTEAMRNLNLSEEALSVFWLMAQEMGKDSWTCLSQVNPETYLIPSTYQRLLGAYAENPYMIDPDADTDTQRSFIDQAATEAAAVGKNYPQGAEFKRAAETLNIPFGSKSAWCKTQDHACFVEVTVVTWPDTIGIRGAYVELIGPETWAAYTNFYCTVYFWGVLRGTYKLTAYNSLFDQVRDITATVNFGANYFTIDMKRDGPNVMPTGFSKGNCKEFKQY